MCDAHLDALSCLQSVISRGFHTDQLRSLAQLYIKHGFLSDEEADTFLSDIPVLGEQDEPEATVMDQMLNHPHSDTGDLLPTSSGVDLSIFVNTFIKSLPVGRGSDQPEQTSPCSHSGTSWNWQVLSIEGFN